MKSELSNMRNHDLSEIYLDHETAILRQAEDENRLEVARLRERLLQDAGNPSAYLDLANALGKDPSCLDLLREGLANCTPDINLYKRAIKELWKANRTDEALEVIRRAEGVLPDANFLKFGAALILPILYETPEQIRYYRERFTSGLKSLIAGVDLDTPEARRSALDVISWRTNYHLAYQGQNDRELQTQYGQLVHRIMAANYPEWTQPLHMPSPPVNGKIRVGYVSMLFQRHTVSKFFLGWLTEHDRNRFEVYTYHLGEWAATDEARRASDRFRHIPGDLERTCRAILADNLHILVFLDLGMFALMTQLAALRLAPIQCATWGHPVTSGLPTVDYFLSSELMEPKDGQDHYSERLIRLPGIGVCYPRPVIPRPLLNKPRSHFGLRDDRTVCWCGQSNYKYLPQHDDLFARIAKRLPCVEFAFVVSRASVGEHLRRRLERGFAAEGIRAEDHCVMVPFLHALDYWNLYFVSDIFLDSLEFSGGATTLEAIASGLPVVTVPGRFMRGRQSYAILRQLDVTETIARDKEEYVDIAVRLGSDKGWRAQVREKMKANHARLYSDTTCVHALEDFFRSAVSERRAIEVLP
jgi:predicted O-linked N-acetylglucosamine transferase (SPINDLY family)